MYCPRYLSQLLGVLVLFLACSSGYAASMTNSWAVEIGSGGREAADALATKHGFINMGQVGNLKDVYHFLKPTANQKKRLNGLPANYQLLNRLQSEDNVVYVQQQERKKWQKKQGGYNIPSDPRWNDQWSLLNTGQLNISDVGRDLNVERAWLQGLTGCGIVVAIVDDGVEYTHSDLHTNYVSALEYDFLDRDSDAFPGTTMAGEREAHGTSVAGIVGMEKGNAVCGLGVAYNSFITGYRLVSNIVGSTDMDDADALSRQNDVVHIYSNSWGPEDDGIHVSGPGTLLRRVLETGTQEGRDGKGSIFTFAAGNGGYQRIDTCAADGYTNSIYTISVGSATSDGRQSIFDESCSGKMVVTFDRDPDNEYRDVLATHVRNTCLRNFTGTSASTPLVSAVLALLLEANPALSWRDVQYLIAYTANRNDLVDGEWITNGRGLRVSHKFGFGAMDAEAIVSRGRHWISVPQQMVQTTVVNNARPITIQHGDTGIFRFAGENDIVFIEHMVVVFTLNFVGVTDSLLEDYISTFNRNESETINWPERGRVLVSLTSPSGTTSQLLPRRFGDIFPDSYHEWPLMSVHFWGENPAGLWTINIQFDDSLGTIEVSIPKVMIYGTSFVPEAVSRVPETCSPECDPTRGCAAPGAQFCDACTNLRIASTRECVTSCPQGHIQRNQYCYSAEQAESTCKAPVPMKGGSSQSLTSWFMLTTVTLAAVTANI